MDRASGIGTEPVNGSDDDWFNVVPFTSVDEQWRLPARPGSATNVPLSSSRTTDTLDDISPRRTRRCVGCGTRVDLLAYRSADGIGNAGQGLRCDLRRQDLADRFIVTRPRALEQGKPFGRELGIDPPPVRLAEQTAQ